MIETLLIIALAIAIFHPTWKYGLIVDDIRRSKEVLSGYLQEGNIIQKLRSRLYGVGTLYHNKRLNIRNEHILSTAIHTLTAIVIYFAFGQNQISFIASILWLINPANNQTSIWLNGRRYAINCLLVACIVAYKPLAVILYPLACLLQANAFFSPVLLGWYGLALFPVAYFLVGKETIEKVKLRFSAGRITSPELTQFHLRKFIPAIKTYGLYCLKMVLPGRTMMCYSHLFYWGITDEGNKDAYCIDGKFFGGVTALLLTGLMAVHFWNTPEFFMVLFLFISTFQWCGLVSATQMFTDRYISLANIFMMYLMTKIASQFLGYYFIPSALLLAGYYMANLKVTFQMYKSLDDFWNYHFFFNAKDPKCYEFKASTLLKTGDPMGAWAVVKQGLQHNPKDYKLNLLAANCMACLQDHKAVLQYMQTAKKNCYYGQEFILKDLQKNIFKFDLDAELKKIEERTSGYSAKERSNIKKIAEFVNA